MQNDTVTTVPAPDDKTAKKRAYARAYYASHKEQMKAAVKKCLAKKAMMKKAAKALVKAAKGADCSALKKKITANIAAANAVCA